MRYFPERTERDRKDAEDCAMWLYQLKQLNKLSVELKEEEKKQTTEHFDENLFNV